MRNLRYSLLILGMLLAFVSNATAASKEKVPVRAEAQDKLPDLKLIDLEGNAVNLQDFAGKKIFLNIWATWCSPCVREMPSIQKLYDSVKDEGVVVLLLSVDQNFNKVAPFLKRKNLDMPAFGLAEQLPDLFNTGSIPSTFIFNSQGELVWKHVGMADYSSKRFQNFLVNEVE